MSLIFKVENAFDGTEITVLSAGEDNAGPFTVTLVYTDPAIGTAEDNQTHSFASFKDAMGKFNELVASEVEAVAGEIA